MANTHTKRHSISLVMRMQINRKRYYSVSTKMLYIIKKGVTIMNVVRMRKN